MIRQHLAILADNKPGVLTHVAGLISRRAINIEFINAGYTEERDVTRINIVVSVEDRYELDQAIKQLAKLIDVIKVVNLVVAPLFVLFFMALFVPWATSRGTVAGGLFAMLVAVLIAFVGIFGITALWIMPVALVSGVLSSMLFSLLDRWLIGRGLLPGK